MTPDLWEKKPGLRQFVSRCISPLMPCSFMLLVNFFSILIINKVSLPRGGNTSVCPQKNYLKGGNLKKFSEGIVQDELTPVPRLSIFVLGSSILCASLSCNADGDPNKDHVQFQERIPFGVLPLKFCMCISGMTHEFKRRTWLANVY